MCYVLYNRLSEAKISKSLKPDKRVVRSNGLGMINLEMMNRDISLAFKMLPVCEAIVGANN